MCMDLIFAEHARAAYRGTPLTAGHISRHADRIATLVLEGIGATEEAPGATTQSQSRVATPEATTP